MASGLDLSKLLLICIGLLATACSGPSSTEDQADEKPTGPNAKIVHELDTVLNHLAKQGTVNGNLLVLKGDDIIYRKSFGKRKLPKGKPLTPDDQFNINSMAKQFIAMAVLMLVDEGKLRLEDRAAMYFPGLPYKEATIKHLLSHTSGIPGIYRRMQKFDTDYWAGRDTITNRDIVDFLITEKPLPDFEPGERWEYSNTNYLMLELLIGELSGTTTRLYLNNKIFGPLKMNRIRIDTEYLVKGTEFNYETFRYDSDYNTIFYHFLERAHYESMKIHLSVNDYVNWEQALRHGTLLPDSLLQLALTPVTLNGGTVAPYGLGWFVEHHPVAGLRQSHSGGGKGFFTNYTRFPEQELAIVYMTNKMAYAEGDLAQLWETIVLGQEYRWPKPSLAEFIRINLTDAKLDSLVKLQQPLSMDPEKFAYNEFQFLKVAQGVYNSGRTEAGNILFQMALNNNQESAYAHNFYGEVLMAAKEDAAAIEQFDIAYKLDNNFTGAKQNVDRLRGLAN